MISAEIPMTLTSTAATSLSHIDFIDYSIKNDLNIVTSKWLAHTRKITIVEAKKILNSFWESNGKLKNYFATFSVLSKSSEGYFLELIDHDKISSVESEIISSEIYAIHAVPLKDKSVQLGMINVPIYDLPGEIEAPWINSEKVNFDDFDTFVDDQDLITTMNNQSLEFDGGEINAESITNPPPEKKMKMVKTTRSFMQNGYQMTEIVNELVPGDDVEMENAQSVKDIPVVAAVAAPVAKAKQSSMMSFFKKK